MAKSLLVIDDSSTICEAIQLALTGEEWELITAAGGAEAKEALQQTRVDAILCDIAPGDEDGYELCRSLGGSAEGSGVPILMMGGNVNATAALAVGAASTLAKPFSSEKLQQTLRETMEQSDFSFEFDDVPIAAQDDEPLAVEPASEDLGLELEPAIGSVASGGFEEIEVIDLGDEDEFEDLELLDDLEPVELSPLDETTGGGPAGPPGAAAVVGAPSAADELDMLDLEEMLAGPGSAAPTEEDTEDVPMESSPETAEQREDSGWEPGAGRTVDGLMLGGDDLPAREHQDAEGALELGVPEPGEPGEHDPTLEEPIPLFVEEAPAEPPPSPLEEAAGELVKATESETAAVEDEQAYDLDASPEGVDSGGAGVAETAQAASYSELERQWALEDGVEGDAGLAAEDVAVGGDDEEALQTIDATDASAGRGDAEPYTPPAADEKVPAEALRDEPGIAAPTGSDLWVDVEGTEPPPEQDLAASGATPLAAGVLAQDDLTEDLDALAVEMSEPEGDADRETLAEEIPALAEDEDLDALAAELSDLEKEEDLDALTVELSDLEKEEDLDALAVEMPDLEAAEGRDTPVVGMPGLVAGENKEPPVVDMSDDGVDEERDTPAPEALEPAPPGDLATLSAEMSGGPSEGHLAESVAAGAGKVVREALQQSLSAEQLAPLVEAAVERVAWEVVPQLAERLIRETIAKLQEAPPES